LHAAKYCHIHKQQDFNASFLTPTIKTQQNIIITRAVGPVLYSRNCIVRLKVYTQVLLLGYILMSIYADQLTVDTVCM